MTQVHLTYSKRKTIREEHVQICINCRCPYCEPDFGATDYRNCLIQRLGGIYQRLIASGQMCLIQREGERVGSGGEAGEWRLKFNGCGGLWVITSVPFVADGALDKVPSPRRVFAPKVAPRCSSRDCATPRHHTSPVP